jgi:putative endonuclease
MKTRLYYVYLMTNVTNNVIYTGVTNNLKKRAWEHKNKVRCGFTAQYNVTKLVYYKIFPYITDAIAREKQIKAGSRADKINLIETKNKSREDLYPLL